MQIVVAHLLIIYNLNKILKNKKFSEKEKNDEIMANMIDEAERQLLIASEKIKENVIAFNFNLILKLF